MDVYTVESKLSAGFQNPPQGGRSGLEVAVDTSYVNFSKEQSRPLAHFTGLLRGSKRS